MKTAVIIFPGSNCDRDLAVAIRQTTGTAPDMIWHGDTSLPPNIDLIAIPGGFSYGDYLRSGALAARSAIMPAIIAAAGRGVSVLGICNGFQILTEAGLLPGALIRNAGISFICRNVALRVVDHKSRFTNAYDAGQIISLPVAHHDGNFTADKATLERIEHEGQVALRYVDAVNGSANGIAGVTNVAGNVLGMMPHPERAVSAAHGGTDGVKLFESLCVPILA